MVPTHFPVGAIASVLAALALAGPADAAQQDLRSPDARDAPAPHAQKRSDVITGGARAPDLRSSDVRNAASPAAPTVSARTPDAPTVVEITAAQGFDWTSAGIGAGGGIALALIAIAATATVSNRSPPAPH